MGDYGISGPGSRCAGDHSGNASELDLRSCPADFYDSGTDPIWPGHCLSFEPGNEVSGRKGNPWLYLQKTAV